MNPNIFSSANTINHDISILNVRKIDRSVSNQTRSASYMLQSDQMHTV